MNWSQLLATNLLRMIIKTPLSLVVVYHMEFNTGSNINNYSWWLGCSCVDLSWWACLWVVTCMGMVIDVSSIGLACCKNFAL